MMFKICLALKKIFVVSAFFKSPLLIANLTVFNWLIDWLIDQLIFICVLPVLYYT